MTSQGSTRRFDLLRPGAHAWAVVGLTAALVLAGIAVSRISLVVVPLVLALFPAALLAPVAGWLTRRGVRAVLAALAVLLGALTLLIGGVAAVVPAFVAQAPELSDAVSRGIEQVEKRLPQLPFGPDVFSVPDLPRAVGDRIAGGGRQVIDQTIQAARRTAEVVAAALARIDGRGRRGRRGRSARCVAARQLGAERVVTMSRHSRFLPELIDLIQDRRIDPGKVSDLQLPLDEAAEGCRGVDSSHPSHSRRPPAARATGPGATGPG
jgi:hypothetical protein